MRRIIPCTMHEKGWRVRLPTSSNDSLGIIGTRRTFRSRMAAVTIWRAAAGQAQGPQTATPPVHPRARSLVRSLPRRTSRPTAGGFRGTPTKLPAAALTTQTRVRVPSYQLLCPVQPIVSIGNQRGRCQVQYCARYSQAQRCRFEGAWREP